MYKAYRFDGKKFVNELVLDAEIEQYIDLYFSGSKSKSEFDRFDSIICESHCGVVKVQDYEEAMCEGDSCYLAAEFAQLRIYKGGFPKTAKESDLELARKLHDLMQEVDENGRWSCQDSIYGDLSTALQRLSDVVDYEETINSGEIIAA